MIDRYLSRKLFYHWQELPLWAGSYSWKLNLPERRLLIELYRQGFFLLFIYKMILAFCNLILNLFAFSCCFFFCSFIHSLLRFQKFLSSLKQIIKPISNIEYSKYSREKKSWTDIDTFGFFHRIFLLSWAEKC